MFEVGELVVLTGYNDRWNGAVGKVLSSNSEETALELVKPHPLNDLYAVGADIGAWDNHLLVKKEKDVVIELRAKVKELRDEADRKDEEANVLEEALNILL